MPLTDVADKAGKFNCMSLGTFIAGITILAWQSVTTFPALVVISLVYGISTGGNISLQPVCVAQVTKDQRLVGTMIGQMYGELDLVVLATDGSS
jgi:MFS family permease